VLSRDEAQEIPIEKFQSAQYLIKDLFSNMEKLINNYDRFIGQIIEGLS
jgi:hypothetical protein